MLGFASSARPAAFLAPFLCAVSDAGSSTPADSDDRALADPEPSVDEMLVRAEQHVQLLGCMHTLSEVQRHVVTLRMLEEASGGEAAARLGLEPGHVAVLLHRAKKELQRCMAA